MSTPCKYTGPALDCAGIATNDTIDVAIEKLGEYLCALEIFPSKNELVHYSETALGSATGGTTPTYVTLANTTYTVETDGDYEINYVGEAVVANSGSITFKVYKNGSAIGTYTQRTVSSNSASILPFSLFISNLSLLEDDIITIRSTSTNNTTTYPVNCVLKITKIS